jgi:hypothetical protein
VSLVLELAGELLHEDAEIRCLGPWIHLRYEENSHL